ncbi:DUF5916 domain-containing protein [Longimicrobium sp.]|uniref:DUF5916 domain-containing protein n=1 Tax=Longimicrobium sp. TaxID=2029185 RepID=UPI002BFF6270|nr:DUF5916 domain-containing protein [Longimicrobium sp.]HSU13980.1 DUF5916 domain-containing protein [Longimicrobium sp.]
MFDRTSSRMALLAAALLAARPALAQQVAATSGQPPARGATAGSPQRTLRAAAATEIHMDGKLDEAAWATAAPAGDFVQQSPSDGSPATLRTEARVLFDGENLYVGMRMHDPHPDSIMAQLTRRDQGSESDGARVFIDSYNDKRTAFVFGLNPKGVKEDFLRYNDGEGIDSDWDAVWDGAAHVDSAGWTAEFRIPLSQLRFNAAAVNAGGRWGLNFRRYLPRRGEVDFWSPIAANSNAFVSLFGELDGLQGLRQAHRLEVMPYVSSKLDHLPTADRTHFRGASTFAGGMGADLKAGLPGGLTLSATINPDFGQVEVDPAVVNLSAFETFFPERRPFFVEGADIFQFGNLNTFNSYGFTQFFYSRRIGRSPQGAIRLDDVDEEHAPDATTILGAGKVSGKIGGWSLGFMDALTNRENGQYRTSGGVDGRYPVEPLTNYFVGRVRRDFHKGATVVGGMVTGVGRDLRGNEFDPFLRSRAAMFGLDGSHSWGNRDWTLSGYLAGTRVSGSADAIARTQRAAAHYYNRPDADYLTYDPTRTSLDGHDAGLSLSHSGKWDMSATYVEVSPGFETNDIGFMNRGDYRAFSTFYGQRNNTLTPTFRNRTAYIYHNAAWNFGGDVIYNGVGTGLQAQWKNFWYSQLSGTVTLPRWDDRSTRGGPAIRRAGGWTVNAYQSTDGRKPLSFDLSAGLGADGDGGWSRNAGVSATYRPTSSVRVSVGPSLTRSRNPTQWVDTQEDPTATATYGNRYIFATVDATELAMDTRLDWTFTPTLSLQLFAQPFVSSNDFHGYRSLARPRSYDFDPFATTSDDDFTFASLRGNAVLRWEYRPGSTLFFVWQQDRNGVTDEGQFRLGDGISNVFDRGSRNVFLIKATYWLNR